MNTVKGILWTNPKSHPDLEPVSVHSVELSLDEPHVDVICWAKRFFLYGDTLTIDGEEKRNFYEGSILFCAEAKNLTYRLP